MFLAPVPEKLPLTMFALQEQVRTLRARIETLEDPALRAAAHESQAQVLERLAPLYWAENPAPPRNATLTRITVADPAENIVGGTIYETDTIGEIRFSVGKHVFQGRTYDVVDWAVGHGFLITEHLKYVTV